MIFSEKRCLGCQKPWHFFCHECNNNIKKYTPYCYVCKHESEDFYVHKTCEKHFPIKQVIVLTRYRQNSIKRLLKHAKYYGKYQVYSDIILKNKAFFDSYRLGEKSLLVPVPMHYLRKWKRWYNQSQKIAAQLSYILDIPVNNRLLYKKKYTKNQSHLSQRLRQKNLQDSFWVRKNSIPKNTTIYLIDDVISTGSTLLEITKLLQKQWFKDIRAIVLASD